MANTLYHSKISLLSQFNIYTKPIAQKAVGFWYFYPFYIAARTPIWAQAAKSMSKEREFIMNQPKINRKEPPKCPAVKSYQSATKRAA
jgi:hypothetical protein